MVAKSSPLSKCRKCPHAMLQHESTFEPYTRLGTRDQILVIKCTRCDCITRGRYPVDWKRA